MNTLTLNENGYIEQQFFKNCEAFISPLVLLSEYTVCTKNVGTAKYSKRIKFLKKILIQKLGSMFICYCFKYLCPSILVNFCQIGTLICDFIFLFRTFFLSGRRRARASMRLIEHKLLFINYNICY